jgi:glycosyltransferase involved in cell wall biosynthesis
VWDPEWPRTVARANGQPGFRRGPGHHVRADLEAFWRTEPLDERWLGQPDVIHSNNFFCPVGLRRARVVYTLHDLGFLDHPEWTTEENRLTCFSGVFNASLYADRIVAVSESSRQHFLRSFPHYPSQRISVVNPGSRFAGPAAGPRPASLPPLLPDRFWLSVGTLEPRKNHRRLLRAYARLRDEGGDGLPLVLAGARGWLMDDFLVELDALGLRQQVLLLGYVDDAALHWLYSSCFAFLYVSLFEGFGLPVLEAMSCGAAVITSDRSSLPEVAGDAGLLVDPDDEAAISTAMLSLLRGEVDRAALRERATDRARGFSWLKVAQKVKAIYAELAG